MPAKRFDPSGTIPSLLRAAQVLDLIRKTYGEAPGYATFRTLTESGAIPSTFTPFHSCKKFGNRRYHWPSVRAAIDKMAGLPGDR